MRLEKRKIEELTPAPYNPRKDLQAGDEAYDDIKRSIEILGYNSPLIVDEAGVIIDGNQHYKTLIDLGYTEIEVIVVDIEDEEKKKALAIALDRIKGEWDNEKLYALLANFEEKDLQELIRAAGIKDDELQNLKDLIVPSEANEDNFDMEAAVKTAEGSPRTKRGDIWILGEHRLMCGDSTDSADVAKLMNGEVADLIITDPPYNVNYGEKVQDLAERLTTCVTRKKSDIKNDNLSDAAFRKFIREAYRAMYGAMREGAAIYVFHADTQGLPFRQEFISANFKLSECLIWEKNTFVLGRQDYHWRHEPILYGWELGEAHYFVDDRSQDTVLLQDELDLNSKTKEELIAIIEEFRQAYKDRTSVIYENKPLRSAMHPTMKPIGLYGKLMLNSSRSGEIVADFFGGSGTLIMAAEQLHRKARVMEYDEVFCDAIIERWESYTGQKAILLNV